MAVIPGYEFGSKSVNTSPVMLSELRALENAIGWTDADATVLRDATALIDQAEDMVDSWRTQIARQPELAKWFFGPDGKPDEHYKAGVKRRFVQWVVDSCTRPHDQRWLDYQEEIGLRHTPAKKNQTEHADTPEHVPLRYLYAFAAPVILGAPAFLAKKGVPASEAERIQRAWTRSVLLHITLWSRPYVEGDLW